MEKQHYDFLPQLDNPANVHRIEMDMIADGSSVLDIGCHTGIMGEILKNKKGAYVIGIDTDADAIEIAKGRLDAAFFLDVEKQGWAERIKTEGFDNVDVILFGDVL